MLAIIYYVLAKALYIYLDMLGELRDIKKKVIVSKAHLEK